MVEYHYDRISHALPFAMVVPNASFDETVVSGLTFSVDGDDSAYAFAQNDRELCLLDCTFQFGRTSGSVVFRSGIGASTLLGNQVVGGSLVSGRGDGILVVRENQIVDGILCSLGNDQVAAPSEITIVDNVVTGANGAAAVHVFSNGTEPLVVQILGNSLDGGGVRLIAEPFFFVVGKYRG